MKNSSRLVFIFLLFASITFTSNAQDEDEKDLNNGTLEEQFDYVYDKSNKYNYNNKTYKVVRAEWIQSLKSHSLDSLAEVHKSLSASENTIATQKSEIEKLQTNLNNTQATLDTTREEKDSMALLGLQMSKTGYNMLLWGIIAALMIALLIFIYKFKNSHVVTKEAQERLVEVQEEYDNHRSVALEREQKVRRQLQDELNKRKHGNQSH
ncbi:tRNA (guanine-N1)-methyltransferase [Neptunitalea lumnitzerae]|uniref:tRNA (Guanine-N1)-methyltransferase n=1 Tax=Neptunitalea lumnitzerae TaxID=2965509 RepID=A0ABQ5MLL2_9FLAO|nr:tRNA (guanine-N1)-methyltransferase [Neptunitalea sp. Y10]GLB50303.1 hypothetical protein Y10_26710 [Neptunitalea sp. Y10]